MSPQRRERSSAGRSLDGRTVIVTRPTDRSTDLVDELERRGARAIVAPVIRIMPIRSATLTNALRALEAGEFEWITLTSRATIDVLADRLPSPRALHAKVATIGDGTAEAFHRWARRDADLQPRTFTTTALARSFPKGRGRVLCARADIAPPGLEESLAAKGWSPTRVDAYRTVFPRSLPAEARAALRAGQVDAVTFTSASTVRGFLGALGPMKGAPRVVCIGPVTAKEARTRGLTVHTVADPHTIEGLVAAVERACRPRSGR